MSRYAGASSLGRTGKKSKSLMVLRRVKGTPTLRTTQGTDCSRKRRVEEASARRVERGMETGGKSGPNLRENRGDGGYRHIRETCLPGLVAHQGQRKMHAVCAADPYRRKKGAEGRGRDISR